MSHEIVKTGLDHVKQNIEKNFPNRSFAMIVLMSVKAQMLIEGITLPFTLILMGNPSTYKSTILEIISCLPNSYVSDSFTPKSFVSHTANVKKTQLESIDNLEKKSVCDIDSFLTEDNNSKEVNANED